MNGWLDPGGSKHCIPVIFPSSMPRITNTIGFLKLSLRWFLPSPGFTQIEVGAWCQRHAATVWGIWTREGPWEWEWKNYVAFQGVKKPWCGVKSYASGLIVEILQTGSTVLHGKRLCVPRAGRRSEGISGRDSSIVAYQKAIILALEGATTHVWWEVNE